MTDIAATSPAVAARPSRASAALADMANGLARWRLWLALAWEDIRTSYKRSVFGVMWITLSFAMFVGVKLAIFIPIFKGVDPGEFSAYLAIGFFVWQFLSMTVTTAPQVFTSSENWIKNDPLPLSLYVYRAITRHMFSFALTAIVVAAALAILTATGHADPPPGEEPKWGVTWTAWLVIPATAAFVLNALWVKLFFGVVCTRYRDIGHLIQAVMRVMFFLSPIFWMPQQMGEQVMAILWWNPLAHFIWILRTPLMYGDPAIESWIFVGVVTLVGWCLAFAAFALYRRRIVFWF